MARWSRDEYVEMLKDPRWQKKRLEILERDEWACTACGDQDSTLHVHHLVYQKGKPWEIDSRHLQTLCADCHTEETESIRESLNALSQAVREFGFRSAAILSVASAFHVSFPVHDPNYVADAIAWSIRDRESQLLLLERYAEHLRALRPDLAVSA